MQIALEEIHLKGNPVSPGIAMGKLFFCRFADDVIFEKSITLDEVEDEVRRYRLALAQSKRDLEKLQLVLENEKISEGRTILDAHMQLLQDPVITDEIEQEIRLSLKNAEFVLQCALQRYKMKFSTLPIAFFRERFYDLQAIVRRVLVCLKSSYLDDHFPTGNLLRESKSIYALEKIGVVYARELSFVDLTEASVSHAQAFMTEVNGATSHAAIAAKAKGVPFVTSIPYEKIERVSDLDTIIIVDGNTGDIYINPSDQTLKYYSSKFDSEANDEYLNQTRSNLNLPAETYDGCPVRLSANIEMAGEVKLLNDHGGSSVGLFRSEYAFLSHINFPSEEEQFLIYKEAVESMSGFPIVIRAFDLGGDKYLLGQKIPFENNPFLGCRAIRFLLQEKELFKMQLKAILRASAYGNLSILLPMISSLAELIKTKELIQTALKEVEEAYGFSLKPIRLGCMIEVPSAALITDLIARECDFLSIGTNDLVQYVLAVDRGNHSLSNLYSPAHPSIIRLIKMIISEANCCGIPVSICGEIAANPKFTPLLLGLGVHELSVSLRQIACIKDAIRNTSIVEATLLAEKALKLTTVEEIEALLI